jgi:aspartyl protease
MYSDRTYAAATLKIHVKIRGIYVNAMLDSGAEVNVMTRALADRAGLTVRTNLALALKTVSGERRKFDGACEEVDISIGGISNTQVIMVIDDIDHKLILGCPFFHDAQLTFVYDEDGYQCAKFANEDRTKIGTTRVCRPQGKEWRDARAGADESGNE